jgi:hypothetical protein
VKKVEVQVSFKENLRKRIFSFVEFLIFQVVGGIWWTRSCWRTMQMMEKESRNIGEARIMDRSCWNWRKGGKKSEKKVLET